MQSVHGQPTIEATDEQDAGIWTDEDYGAYAVGVVWVGLCWGDTIVAAALPAVSVACMVSGIVAGVVPGAVVVEASLPNQRGTLRQLPGPRRLYPY